MNRTLLAASGITGLLALASSPVFAAAEGTEGTSFAIQPYYWGSNIDGSFSPSRGVPKANASANFGDTGQLDSGWGINGDARWGRFGIMAEYGNLRFSDNAKILGEKTPFDVDTKLTNLSAYYRVDNSPNMDVDLYAGGRWWKVDTNLKAFGKDDKNWTDVVVGARLQYQPGQHWFFKGLGDYGGGDSDSTWQLYAAGGYQFSPNWSAELGYRKLSVDYDKSGFLYDVSHDGLLAGINFKF